MDYEGNLHINQENINRAVYEIIPLIQEYNKAVSGGLARFAIPAFNTRIQSKINDVLDKYDLWGFDTVDGLIQGLDRSGIIVPASIETQIRSLASHGMRNLNEKGTLEKRFIRSNTKEAKDSRYSELARKLLKELDDHYGYKSHMGYDIGPDEICKFLVDNNVADSESRKQIYSFMKRINPDNITMVVAGPLMRYTDKEVKESASNIKQNPFKPKTFGERDYLEAMFAKDVLPMLPKQEYYKNEYGEWESQDYYLDKAGRWQLKPETKARFVEKPRVKEVQNEYGPDGRNTVGKREKQFGRSREVHVNPLAGLPKELQVYPAYTEDAEKWLHDEYRPSLMKKREWLRPEKYVERDETE